jgi:hypothetical protein
MLRRLFLIERFALVGVLLVGSGLGQNIPEQTQSNIRQLIDDLQQDLVKGNQIDQLFSPTSRLTEKLKIDALAQHGFLSFKVMNFTTADLQLLDADHAALPATVEWSTRGQEASKTTTLRFVKERGTWYFERADFWEVSTWWFFFPLIGIAIAYGCGAVVMYRHTNRQGWRNVRKKATWQALAVIPFSPFVYFSKRPWETT